MQIELTKTLKPLIHILLSWLERMIHNHEVEGSCPSLATTYNTPKPHIYGVFCCLKIFGEGGLGVESFG
jgi:hypothetical protein